MDEKEKKLREDLEFHLDTLRRNLEVVSMEDLKAKYAKPFKDLKDNICKTATAYTQYISLSGIRIKSRYGDEAVKYINEAIKAVNNNLPIDIISISIKQTLEDLGKITGANVSEDIINEIFSKFCLGK